MKKFLLGAAAAIVLTASAPAHADVLTDMGHAYERDTYHQYFENDGPGAENKTKWHTQPADKVDLNLTAEKIFAAMFEDRDRFVVIKFFKLWATPEEKKYTGPTAQNLSDIEGLRFWGLMRVQEMTELVVFKKVCHVTSPILDTIESQWKDLPSDILDKRVDYTVKIAKNFDKIIGPGSFCSRMTADLKDHQFDHIFKTAKEMGVR